jgi:ATP-dependent DNA helicase PIF1
VLHLKIGVPIMLLRNLDPSRGLCNGTRLIVTQLTSRVIEGEIITGKAKGAKAYIPQHYYNLSRNQMTFQTKTSTISYKCVICHDNQQEPRTNT